MWYRTQNEAYAHRVNGQLVVARDVSATGHKSYAVMTRSQIDALGPGHVYEVISPTSVCFLYFDLEHPRIPGDPGDDELCEDLIAGVRSLLHELYNVSFDNEDICLCDSSNASKFSRHLIFPVQFKNNWGHMRNFVRALLDRGTCSHTWEIATRAGSVRRRCVDDGVYTKNRCFRLPTQSKYGSDRVMVPRTGGNISDYLIQVSEEDDPLEFVDTVLKPNVNVRKPRGGTKSPVNYTDSYSLISKLNVPFTWNHKLTSMDHSTLLQGIPPAQSHALWWRIGAAYKGCGGTLRDFYELWGSKTQTWERCRSQWKYWKRMLGFPFLRACALMCCSCPEEEVLLEEAFGFHTDDMRVVEVKQRYLNPLRFPRAKCLVIKSPTGTGKSTAAKYLLRPYCNKRILWIVSNRALAYNSQSTLNKLNYFAFDGRLSFQNYLSTNRPLHNCKHLVCTVQSLHRTIIQRKAYDCVVIDEISSVLEDMAGKTCKRVEQNMDQLEWICKNCEQFIAMDAHVMDSCKAFVKGNFTKDEICIIINKHRGPRRQARLLPKPQCTNLSVLRGEKLRKATALYERLLDCWAAQCPAFFVCNNRQLGDFVETTFLKNSLVHAILVCQTNLPTEIISEILSFLPKSPGLDRPIKYDWIHRDDGRDLSYFKPANVMREWSQLDLLMYTLKITQGVDYKPKEPHFGCGIVYTTPNTVVPRRVLQQAGRVRQLGKNPFADCPVTFFAFGSRVCRPHLPQCGLGRIRAFADEQEYFLDFVSKHYGHRAASVLYEPSPMWREIYLHLANERETFLHYPLASYHWWLRHDGYEIIFDPRLRPKVDWSRIEAKKAVKLPYDEIRHISQFEYELHTGPRTPEILKYEFRNFVFRMSPDEEPDMWDFYTNHRGQVRNVTHEKFSDMSALIVKTYEGKSPLSQEPGEWAKMLPCKLHIIGELATALCLPGNCFWNNDKAEISIEQWESARTYIKEQETQICATWKIQRPQTKDWVATLLKMCLKRWGDYRIKTTTRRVDRVRQVCPLNPRYTLDEWTLCLDSSPTIKKLFYDRYPQNRLVAKHVKTFVSTFRTKWKRDNPPQKVPKSTRELLTAPWQNLLYHKP